MLERVRTNYGRIENILRFGLLDPIEYYISDTYKVVYVENPKVACTAIKEAIFGRGGESQTEFHSRLRSVARLKVPPHAREYLHFSFFRNPLSRLHSCFRDKVKKHGEEERTVYDLLFHRVVFRVLGGLNLAKRPLTFEEFSAAVSRIPDMLSDRHIRSQAPVYEAVVGAPKHFVGFLENIGADWTALQSMCELPDLKVSNRSQGTTEAASDALVLKRYSRDYSLLGYSNASSPDAHPQTRGQE